MEDVARAARGDPTAFERVYRRNFDRVHALARRMLGPDEAEDATQEIFFRAWTKLGSYRGEAAFSTWLHRLALNMLIRRASSVRRVARATISVADDAIVANAISLDMRLDVDRALAALPPDLRAAVILHDIEGYSHKEIGELLGISLSAARMRLYRARLALRASAGGG
ncbi:MAG TPA: RNA polymerase sigma factor [Gemmatimonadota bacterium]|nr:RNA polymerase sigma factor [Gemmatimonadota bacterium]